MAMQRMWINQPSILQALHRYHGLNVLCDLREKETITVYPVSGKLCSMVIPRNCLSNGWNENEY